MHLCVIAGRREKYKHSTLTKHDNYFRRLVYQSKTSFEAAEIKLTWSLVPGGRCNLEPEKYQQWWSKIGERTTSQIAHQSSWTNRLLLTPSSCFGFPVLQIPRQKSEWCISAAGATKLTVMRRKAILVWGKNPFKSKVECGWSWRLVYNCREPQNMIW